MNRRAVVWAIAFGFGAAAGCGKTASSPPAASGGATPTTAVEAPSGGAIPHGDHNPHHGGIVMMKGDLHYEVVFDATGHRHQLYFTDAVREDLPAALASEVALTIHRPGEADEPVPLQIDGTGESWIGSGRAVAHPDKTTVQVRFTIAHEPYSIELPFAAPK
ncbi:MAG TPA: hypothetical protein VH583_12575 [Vicinamibacterales bacterium]|jgi:hypothetical protein